MGGGGGGSVGMLGKGGSVGSPVVLAGASVVLLEDSSPETMTVSAEGGAVVDAVGGGEVVD
jgi:hypothetical protein